MTRTTGFEWNKFYNDKGVWTDDTYHDDTVLLVDGKQVDDFENIPVNATVKIEAGYVVVDGINSENTPSLESVFKAWRKRQNTCTLCVECSRDKRDAVVAAIKKAGGRMV